LARAGEIDKAEQLATQVPDRLLVRIGVLLEIAGDKNLVISLAALFKRAMKIVDRKLVQCAPMLQSDA
jgi:hypothetical protein